MTARRGWLRRGRGAAAVVVASFAVLLAAPAPSARAADEPIARTPEFTKSVEEAIAKGVAWLRTQQRPDGTFTDFMNGMAEVALAYHTLRVCKVPADDPGAALAFDYLRKAYDERAWLMKPSGGKGYSTDDMGLLLWALADRAQVQPPADETEEVSYSPSALDHAWMTRIAAYLEKVQLPNGAWPSHPNVHEQGETDYWYTHLALLGLKAARRAGVKVKQPTWSRAREFLLNQQEQTGPVVPQLPSPAGRPPAKTVRARGWDLHQRRGGEFFSPLDSGTAEALTSLAICHSELLRLEKGKTTPNARVESAVRDGIGFLSTRTHALQVLEGGGRDVRSYYFEHAFSLERAGDLLGYERFGDVDWFGRGATAIVRLQEPSGAWHLSRPPTSTESREMIQSDAVKATCYALLFLARGTPRARWTTTVGGDDTDIRFDGAAALAEKDFEDFLDLVLARWNRATDAAVQERLLAKTTAVGPRIVAPAVRRLDSDKAEVRAAAFALLQRATGLDHGYDPAADAAARAEAVARWRAWWTEHAETLRFDAAKDRLVP